MQVQRGKKRERVCYEIVGVVTCLVCNNAVRLFTIVRLFVQEFFHAFPKLLFSFSLTQWILSGQGLGVENAGWDNNKSFAVRTNGNAFESLSEIEFIFPCAGLCFEILWSTLSVFFSIGLLETKQEREGDDITALIFSSLTFIKL